MLHERPIRLVACRSHGQPRDPRAVAGAGLPVGGRRRDRDHRARPAHDRVLRVAAACFYRSSPRFEQWVLNLPTIGPMVRDYRAGLGMPKRAKVAAITSIVVVCSLSAFVAVDRVLVKVADSRRRRGGCGLDPVADPDPGDTAPAERAYATPRPLGIPGRVFRVAAIAEAVSWVGLLLRHVPEVRARRRRDRRRGVRPHPRRRRARSTSAVALWAGWRLRWASRALMLAPARLRAAAGHDRVRTLGIPHRPPRPPLTSPRLRGCSSMARAPAFQAGYAGSIPVTRSAERSGQRVISRAGAMALANAELPRASRCSVLPGHGGHLAPVGG